jgi:hypothetical protein
MALPHGADHDATAEIDERISTRDRRIEELRQEIDEQRDVITRMREYVEDYANIIEAWKETFGMVTTGRGRGSRSGMSGTS